MPANRAVTGSFQGSSMSAVMLESDLMLSIDKKMFQRNPVGAFEGVPVRRVRVRGSNFMLQAVVWCLPSARNSHLYL